MKSPGKNLAYYAAAPKTAPHDQALLTFYWLYERDRIPPYRPSPSLNFKSTRTKTRLYQGARAAGRGRERGGARSDTAASGQNGPTSHRGRHQACQPLMMQYASLKKIFIKVVSGVYGLIRRICIYLGGVWIHGSRNVYTWCVLEHFTSPPYASCFWG